MSARMLLLLLLVVAGVIITLGARGSGPSPMVNGSVEDTPSFAAGLLEHLSAVEAAGDSLVELGRSRERNLLVVGQRQSAMNAALDSTDVWLAQQAAHHDDPAVIAYRDGAEQIRQAMSDAQSAFFRLDWEGIAAANVTLQAGVDDVNAASSQLRSGRTD